MNTIMWVLCLFPVAVLAEDLRLAVRQFLGCGDACRFLDHDIVLDADAHQERCRRKGCGHQQALTALEAEYLLDEKVEAFSVATIEETF